MALDFLLKADYLLFLFKSFRKTIVFCEVGGYKVSSKASGAIGGFGAIGGAGGSGAIGDAADGNGAIGTAGTSSIKL